MEKVLLTQKELAERWNCSVQSIEGHRKSGILKQCPNVPGIRYHIDHIMELEEVKLEKFSPVYRRKLENENEQLKQELDKYKQIVADIFKQTSGFVSVK